MVIAGKVRHPSKRRKPFSTAFFGGDAGQESSSSCEVEGVVTSGVLVEPVFPEISGAAAGVNAAQGEDVLGAGDRPPHARLFAAGADDGFAAGLDDPRADEQSLPAKRAACRAGILSRPCFL